jgi:hypothetical protein
MAIFHWFLRASAIAGAATCFAMSAVIGVP